MERTPLREEFFGAAHRDPWTHVIQRMWADAWAMGYEQALRDAEADGELSSERRNSKSFPDRRIDGLEQLTDRRRKAEAEYLVALAAIGPLVPQRPPA